MRISDWSSDVCSSDLLDCLLEGSKQAVLDAEKTLPDTADDATRDMILFGAVGGNVKVYNLSRFTFDSLKGQEPGQLHQNLIDYITKRSEEHTSELQSLMRISYAVFCLKKKKQKTTHTTPYSYSLKTL